MTTMLPRRSPNRHEQDFIAVARLLMICGLVWHHLFELPGSTHSPRTSMAGVDHFFPEFINSMSHMALMTAVPLLSVISGYLFFCRPTLDFSDLLLRRFHSVALPAWLWSALWLGLAYVLYATTGNSGYFAWADYGFDNITPLTVINGIFGLTREPFAFQFWFVHDLLLTLVLTPLIHGFLRLLQWKLLPIIGVLWLFIPEPPLFFSGNVPVFFTLGAWLTLPGSPGLAPALQRVRRYQSPLLLGFTAALLARVMSYRFGNFDTLLQGYGFLCLLRILGVLSAGSLVYGMVTSKSALTAWFSRYSGYSFFIFSMHFPLIALVQEAVLRIPAHATAPGLLLSWLFIPPLVIALCIAAALWCERYVPALMNVLNGGRQTGTVQLPTRLPRGVP